VVVFVFIFCYCLFFVELQKSIKGDKPGEAAVIFCSQSKELRVELVRLIPKDNGLKTLTANKIPTSRGQKCKDRPGVSAGCHQFDWAYYFQVHILGLGKYDKDCSISEFL
jgi:hypothetical protein